MKAIRVSTLSLACLLLSSATGARLARAGCTDLGCMRVDWTELTGTPAAPSGAKLHGRIAWQASEAWADNHPIRGDMQGYIHLGCNSAGAGCQDRLAPLLAAAGARQPASFSGHFTGKPRPDFVHAEGEPSAPLLEYWPSVASIHNESNVCQAVLKEVPGPDAGVGVDPTSGPGGCAVAFARRPGAGSSLLVAAALSLMLSLSLRRRRPRA